MGIKSSINKVFHHTKKKAKEIHKKVQEMKSKNKKEIVIEDKANAKKEEKRERVLVDLSVASIVKCTIAVTLIYFSVVFLGEIWSILFIFLISLFLTAAFSPLVDWLERHHVPRWLGIFLIYFLAFFVLIFAVGLIAYLIINQIPGLMNSLVDSIIEIVKSFSSFVDSVSKGNADIPFSDILLPTLQGLAKAIDPTAIDNMLESFLKNFLSSVGNTAQGTVGFVVNVFTIVLSGMMNLFIVLMMTFFLILEKNSLSKFFHSILPSRYSGYAGNKTTMVQKKIGEWMRGQLTICIIIGLMVGVGLSLIGVPYAGSLGVIAGIAELIPYLGPFIAGVPAVLVAINEDPMLGFWALILYIILQTIEGNILVPMIMNKAVGLSPVVILIAMMIGSQFFGILGMILAVPLATTVALFVKDYADMEK